MTIRFRCPKCQKQVGASDTHAGRRVKCPDCSTVIVVPTPGAKKKAPAPAAEQPQRTAPAPSTAEQQQRQAPAEPTPLGMDPDLLSMVDDMQASAPVKPLPNLAQKPTATPFKLPKLDGDWWLILKNLPPELIGLAVIVFVSLLMLIFGNIVTKVFFLLVALAAVNGYLLGASKVASALAGLLIAAFLGVPLGKAFEGLIGGMLGTTGLTNRMISVVVVTVVLVAIIAIALQFVLRRFLAEKPEWQRYDRQAGLCIGLAEGLLLGLVMIWAVLSLDPVAQTSIAQADENNLPVNPVAKMVGTLAATARESTVGSIAQAVNPLAEMRLFALFQKGLIVLNDPAAREAFVNHAAMKNVLERPSIKQAVDLFSRDPTIKQVLEAKEGITSGGMRSILDSPTILVILDTTDVVRDLTPIADQIELAINEAFEEVGAPAPPGAQADPDAQADPAEATAPAE